VKACTTLSATEKLVWLEHYELDQGPDGAFIGAGPLAARLGLSREVIEGYRRRLAAKRLVVRDPRGHGKTDRWYVDLPPQCRPQARRLTPDQVAVYAERLELHLDTLRPAPQPPASGEPTPTTAQAQTTDRNPPLWYAPGSHSIELDPAQSGMHQSATPSTTVGGEVGEVGEVRQVQDKDSIRGERTAPVDENGAPPTWPGAPPEDGAEDAPDAWPWP